LTGKLRVEEMKTRKRPKGVEHLGVRPLLLISNAAGGFLLGIENVERRETIHNKVEVRGFRKE